MRPPHGVIAVLVIAALLAGCGSETEPAAPGFPLPVQQEEMDSADALISGRLKESRDGCIELVAEGESYLPIWPAGYSVARRDGQLVIVDGGGEDVAAIGDLVDLGGGEIERELAEESAGDSLSDQCEIGHYWLVSLAE